MLFAKRNLITSAKRHSAALSALQLLIHHDVFLTSQHIACYLAQDNEFDCSPIIKEVWAAKKNCFLPVLSPQKKQGLAFVAYLSHDILCLNRYKILEPQHKEVWPIKALDFILVPLVGFDLQGNRLGMGGGYYDRTLEFLKGKLHQKPYLIGLAYECQQVPEIPKGPYDIPLDAVLTEKAFYWIGTCVK